MEVRGLANSCFLFVPTGIVSFLLTCAMMFSCDICDIDSIVPIMHFCYGESHVALLFGTAVLKFPITKYSSCC